MEVTETEKGARMDNESKMLRTPSAKQQITSRLAREMKQYHHKLTDPSHNIQYFTTKQKVLHFYPHKLEKKTKEMGERCTSLKIINTK